MIDRARAVALCVVCCLVIAVILKILKIIGGATYKLLGGQLAGGHGERGSASL